MKEQPAPAVPVAPELKGSDRLWKPPETLHTSDQSLMRIADGLERIASAMEEKNKANGNGKHK